MPFRIPIRACRLATMSSGSTDSGALGPDSVRLALPAEGQAIAVLQTRWLDQLGFEHPHAEQMTLAWTEAILAPPLAAFRVLVAVEAGAQVVGFAAIGPSDDPDAEPTDGLIGEFLIDAAHRGRGHGSRLMQACADTLRTDGFERATWWLATTDDQLRGFAQSAGWEPDGAHREIGEESGDQTRLRQVRLHTLL